MSTSHILAIYEHASKPFPFRPVSDAHPVPHAPPHFPNCRSSSLGPPCADPHPQPLPIPLPWTHHLYFFPLPFAPFHFSLGKLITSFARRSLVQHHRLDGTSL